jgi:hypothetical protein
VKTRAAAALGEATEGEVMGQVVVAARFLHWQVENQWWVRFEVPGDGHRDFGPYTSEADAIRVKGDLMMRSRLFEG